MNVKISEAVLGRIRESMDHGRNRIEDTASSAPKSVDAGELSAMMHGMLSKLTDSAGTISEVLSVVRDRVDDAAANFWEQDAETAAEAKQRETSM